MPSRAHRQAREDPWTGVVATPETHSAEVFPPLPETEGAAHRWCQALLHHWSLDPCSLQVLAVVDELLGNALHHGKGSVQVDLRQRSGRIWIGVRDDGSGPIRAAGVFPPRGASHGLGRVARASRVWGVNRHCGGGATVWSEVEMQAVDSPGRVAHAR
jgi:anti-sigma regulatory factor (Ser/Thr protein kinase)